MNSGERQHFPMGLHWRDCSGYSFDSFGRDPGNTCTFVGYSHRHRWRDWW